MGHPGAEGNRAALARGGHVGRMAFLRFPTVRGYARDVSTGAHQFCDVYLDSKSGNEELPAGDHWVRYLGNPLAGRKGRLPHGLRGFMADYGKLFGESWRPGL